MLAKYFVLTAAHCFGYEAKVGQLVRRNKEEGRYIGTVKRRDYAARRVVDGEGILIDESLRSHAVLNDRPLKVEPIQGVQKARVRKDVCWSGVTHGPECGKVLFFDEGAFFDEGGPTGGKVKAVYVASGVSFEGDSGGPVWDPITHNAVGIITGSTSAMGGVCWKNAAGKEGCNRMAFTPLRPGGGSPGIELTLGVGILWQG